MTEQFSTVIEYRYDEIPTDDLTETLARLGTSGWRLADIQYDERKHPFYMARANVRQNFARVVMDRRGGSRD